MSMNAENQMEETKSNKSRSIILYISLFIVCLGSCAGHYLLYGIPETVAIRMTGLVVTGLLVTVFSFNAGSAYESLFGNNADNPGRFYIAFMAVSVLGILQPAMPASAWPMVSCFVLLTVLSNIPAGITASCVCLIMSAASGGAAGLSYVFVYIFAGITAAVLISHIDESFRTTLPILITLIILFLGLAVVTFTTNSVFSVEMLIYPTVNITITLILMLFILKLYSAKVIFKQKDDYLELNDPECMLLTKLKNISPADYKKTVHVVYFCDRVSSALGLNTDVVKCAGLYHRIGVIGGAYNWENTRIVCEESNIPQTVVDILKELEDPNTPMRRTETAVLYMCECMVSSVQYLFGKNKDIKLDYAELTEAIFKQRFEAGLFKDNDISIGQYEKMKKVFIEEKLYYDFLR